MSLLYISPGWPRVTLAFPLRELETFLYVAGKVRNKPPCSKLLEKYLVVSTVGNTMLLTEKEKRGVRVLFYP